MDSGHFDPIAGDDNNVTIDSQRGHFDPLPSQTNLYNTRIHALIALLCKDAILSLLSHQVPASLERVTLHHPPQRPIAVQS
jgi:hypothetical protein